MKKANTQKNILLKTAQGNANPNFFLPPFGVLIFLSLKRINL